MWRLAAAVWMLASLPSINASILTEPDTAAMYTRSDVVCSGTVISIGAVTLTSSTSELAQGSTFRKVATVQPIQCYKGAVNTDQPIEVDFAASNPNPQAALVVGERAIMFLQEGQGGAYVFAEPSGSVFSFGSIPPSAQQGGLDRLQDSLAAALTNGPKEDQLRAAMLLLGLDSVNPVVAKAIASAGASSDPEIKMPVIAVLIKNGSNAGNELLTSYLKTNIAIDSEPSGISQVMSVLGQVSDSRYVIKMQQLSSASLPEIRLGAVEALRNMRSSVAIPNLIARLDDSDGDIRYVALISLAEIVDKTGEYAPSMELYNKRPDYYLTLWKTWAKSYSPATPK